MRKNAVKRKSTWTKLKEGSVLINTDASFNLENLR
jgi:hypothetical protein